MSNNLRGAYMKLCSIVNSMTKFQEREGGVNVPLNEAMTLGTT